MSIPVFRNYCVIGLGDIESLKKDLSYVSETKVNFVTGEGLIIATFSSSAHLSEIESFFNLGKRSYVIFEMTPGFYSANIADKEIQEAVFGGPIGNAKIGARIEEMLTGMALSMSGDVQTNQTVEDNDGEEIEITEEMFDTVLDKISREGIGKINEKDKEILDKYSSKK